MGLEPLTSGSRSERASARSDLPTKGDASRHPIAPSIRVLLSYAST